MNYFEEVMKDMIVQLSILCESPVENTTDGVCEAKAKVYALGSCNDKAKADMISSRWMWAHCEYEYHKMKAEQQTK